MIPESFKSEVRIFLFFLPRFTLRGSSPRSSAFAFSPPSCCTDEFPPNIALPMPQGKFVHCFSPFFVPPTPSPPPHPLFGPRGLEYLNALFFFRHYGEKRRSILQCTSPLPSTSFPTRFFFLLRVFLFLLAFCRSGPILFFFLGTLQRSRRPSRFELDVDAVTFLSFLLVPATRVRSLPPPAKRRFPSSRRPPLLFFCHFSSRFQHFISKRFHPTSLGGRGRSRFFFLLTRFLLDARALPQRPPSPFKVQKILKFFASSESFFLFDGSCGNCLRLPPFVFFPFPLWSPFLEDPLFCASEVAYRRRRAYVIT